MQRWIWPRRGLKRAWRYAWHRVTRISASPHAIAVGFAAGAFASFTPFVGGHFVLAGLLAFLVGGNILASALGTGVGNPITFPFIWLSTYNLGGLAMGYESRHAIDLHMPDGAMASLLTAPGTALEQAWSVAEPVFLPMLVGSIPLGLLMAIASYIVVYPAVDSYQRRRKHRLAVRYQHNKAQNV